MVDSARRKFLATTPVVLGAAALTSGCSTPSDAQIYEDVAARTWGAGPWIDAKGAALSLELVRCATLAPSSHNTQCWRFAIEGPLITVLPDLRRRCPAVDPDDHHLFVSLGCAAENLVQAAWAHGMRPETEFDAGKQAIRVTLTPAKAHVSALYAAMTLRQSTRGDYDPKPLSNDELGLLERAAHADGVRTLLLTARTDVERVLDHVVQANTLQMGDVAFVKELEHWIRFNGRQAVRTQDGLYSAATGNPTVPTWLGEWAFGWFYTPQSENDKIVRQMRSSAGIAIFAGQSADKPHWVEVGRCYERFALQAAALGIRTALMNQPVEVAAVRPQFAAAFGLEGLRPDLVVRFGRGTALPRSLRRSVQAVLV